MKMARIGITLPPSGSREFKLYDLDTGAMLPGDNITLHVSDQKITSATVTLLISGIVGDENA
jgi:hypothetical protein